MELEEFFNECVNMVADRVTKVVLKRLADVEAEKDESEHMTYKQIEQEYGISRYTVDRRVREHRLPKIRDNRHVLFLRKDVKALFLPVVFGKVSSRKYHRMMNAV